MMKKQIANGLFIATGAFVLLVPFAGAQAPRRFGGAYTALASGQQRLVADWVSRFNVVTGLESEPGTFYDELVKLSTKTTFDAVTHALMETTLSDESGASLGTALDLIESLETVRGKVKGAGGDRQFRMYCVLKADAIETLGRSREFKRKSDNTVFHKGYPVNYRQQGGMPSIQISIARDGRRADIDVDYRSSSFPSALFNGHLSSSNSDVRAGDNDDRHNGRWTGLQNWWRDVFGVRLRSDYDDTVANEAFQIPDVPRAGKETIENMMHDFLSAWLLEGNILEAMGYISERAYPCVALDTFGDVDLGMAPFTLMMGMKAASDGFRGRESLEDLVVGVRLADRALKLVRQQYHAQFVIYSVPDDVALELDCASRLKLNEENKRASREYGNYFGSTFFVNTPDGMGETVVLLWARESDYWKIVSFESEPMKDDRMAGLHEPPPIAVFRIPTREGFRSAAHDFMTKWFITKDYDGAFDYMSPKTYSCFNLYRGETVPEATSLEEAGRYLRDSVRESGERVGPRTELASFLSGVEPSHSVVRVMTHPDEEAFTLVGVPNIIADWADCARRDRDEALPDEMPLDYGKAFGANFRFRTQSGEAPIFRTLWVEEDGEWRIISFDIADP